MECSMGLKLAMTLMQEDALLIVLVQIQILLVQEEVRQLHQYVHAYLDSVKSENYAYQFAVIPRLLGMRYVMMEIKVDA